VSPFYRLWINADELELDIETGVFDETPVTAPSIVEGYFETEDDLIDAMEQVRVLIAKLAVKKKNDSEEDY